MQQQASQKHALEFLLAVFTVHSSRRMAPQQQIGAQINLDDQALSALQQERERLANAVHHLRRSIEKLQAAGDDPEYTQAIQARQLLH